MTLHSTSTASLEQAIRSWVSEFGDKLTPRVVSAPRECLPQRHVRRPVNASYFKKSSLVVALRNKPHQASLLCSNGSRQQPIGPDAKLEVEVGESSRLTLLLLQQCASEIPHHELDVCEHAVVRNG